MHLKDNLTIFYCSYKIHINTQLQQQEKARELILRLKVNDDYDVKLYSPHIKFVGCLPVSVRDNN